MKISFFGQVARKLYVIGGQRNKQPLSDMLTFDLQSQETEVLANGKEAKGICLCVRFLVTQTLQCQLLVSPPGQPLTRCTMKYISSQYTLVFSDWCSWISFL